MSCEDVEPDMIPLALIPAKAYSQRLPRKNLRLLAGKPLVAWAIEGAIASGVFREVWVSSEDDEVLELAGGWGAERLRRPPALALPAATVAHVVQHARQELEHAGPVYLLTPTSPFRSAISIAQVWARFVSLPAAGALISLRPADPPEWTLRWEPISGNVGALNPMMVDLPRGMLPKAWRHDGSHFILGGAERRGGPIGFEADPIEAVDINEQADLDYAEFLLATGRVPWVTA